MSNEGSPNQLPQFQNSVDVKLDYIQRDIRDIKSDVSTIKNDFVTRREFVDGMKNLRDEIPDETDHEQRLRRIENLAWKLIGGLIVCQIIILPVVLFLLYKSIK